MAVGIRVALDTSPLYMSRAGVARYVAGLRRGLGELSNSRWEVKEVAWPVENFEFAQPARALRTAWRELVWARWLAPAQLRGAALVHHTYGPLMPFLSGPRHVMTLCDLALLRQPGRFRSWHRRAGVARLRHVTAADRVICISRFTADEAMTLLGLPASLIDVVPLAPTLAETEELIPGLPDDFYLFVGSLEPGKNLRFLREVWERGGASLPSLVVVGVRWLDVPNEGPPPPNWIYLGYQNDAALLGLYRRAKALLFPSLYEGFGLPPLEAMAAGCPVIAAPRASLPEVVGTAGSLVELEARRWLDAMARIEREPETWRTLGRTHAAHFSWRRCAEQTLAVYANVLGY